MKTLLLTTCCALLSVATMADDFTLPWHTIDSGGGVSVSNDRRFSVSGIIGQPGAGASSGGRFTLEGGYWNSVPCADRLTITHFVEDSLPMHPMFVTVTWPASDSGDCVLETTTELRSDPRLIVWTPVAFRRMGDVNFYSTEANGPARFFRLRR